MDIINSHLNRPVIATNDLGIEITTQHDNHLGGATFLGSRFGTIDFLKLQYAIIITFFSNIFCIIITYFKYNAQQ